MWTPVGYKNVDEVTYAVDLEYPVDGSIYTVQVLVDGRDHDIHMDWMNYVYEGLSAEDESARLLVQGNVDNFDDALATAACYLETVGEIWHSDEQPWLWYNRYTSTEEAEEQTDLADLVVSTAETLQSAWKAVKVKGNSKDINEVKWMINQLNSISEDMDPEEAITILSEISERLLRMKIYKKI